MRIDRLSASGFESYSDCEMKYFLGYALGFEDSAGPAALMGTIAHQVCETFSRLSMLKHRSDSKFWDQEYIWKICFNRFYKENPEIAGQIKNDKLKVICKGLTELLNGPNSPIRTNTIAAEQYFRIPLEEKRFILPNGKYLCITGKIDRVDKIDDDTIEVYDYKSGSRKAWLSNNKEKMGPEELGQKFQAQMYYLAARTLYPQYKTVRLIFDYFVDGGPIPAFIFDEDIVKIKDIIEARMLSILNNKDPQRLYPDGGKESWRCKMCGYSSGKSNICNMVYDEIKENGFEFTENKYITLNYRKK